MVGFVKFPSGEFTIVAVVNLLNRKLSNSDAKDSICNRLCLHQLQYCYTANTACSPAQLQILSKTIPIIISHELLSTEG